MIDVSGVVPDVRGVLRASELPPLERRPVWSYEALTGRLVELSGGSESASATSMTPTRSTTTSSTMTTAVALVAEAQRRGEPVAWITTGDSCAYPPDMAEHGVDLDTLLIVRVPDGPDVPRAADKLVRSGAFGLAVLDIGETRNVPAPLLSRLMQLARKHDAVVMCLTRKSADTPSLSSIVSLRGDVRCVPVPGGVYDCRIRVIKDKHGSPVWEHRSRYRGPLGLC